VIQKDTTLTSDAFFSGVRRQLWRSLALMLVDGLVLAIMLFAVAFWLTRPLPMEHLLAGVAAPFLLFWWICQPFLFPILVEYPDASLGDIYHQVVFMAFMHPLYALSLMVVVSSLALIGLLLLGPALLVLGPFAALIAIQGSWVLMGAAISDLILARDSHNPQEDSSVHGVPPAH
jgi:hypothetical protein